MSASLHSLPNAVVHTIMHSLQAKEIISLARCSRWTLECADSAFAWRDCSALLLHWSVPVAVPPPSRLFRRIPLSLTTTCFAVSDAEMPRVLLCLQSCPRIVQLGWTQWSLTVENGLQLLTHPALQSVRNLGLSMGCREEWLPAIAALPCLSTLDLTFSNVTPTAL